MMMAVSLSAIILSIGCALFYATADAFRKAVPAGCPSELILFYFVGGHVPVLAAWALWTGETQISQDYLIPGLADAVFGLGANLLFLVAIRRSALSLMVPLLALIPVLTLLAGGLTLGEWPSARQDGGILLVAVGLFALFQPATAKPGLRAAWQVLRAEKGTLPMLAVVILWSATPVLDKLCLAQTSVAMHGLIQVFLIWLALGAWVMRRGWAALRLPRTVVGPVSASALAGVLAYGLQLAAYSIAFVAVVELIKRTVGLLASLVLGRAAFSEPITPARIAGIVILALGLPLVMLP